MLWTSLLGLKMLCHWRTAFRRFVKLHCLPLLSKRRKPITHRHTATSHKTPNPEI